MGGNRIANMPFGKLRGQSEIGNTKSGDIGNICFPLFSNDDVIAK